MFVILDCEILLVLQNIAYVVRCHVSTSGFNSSDEFSRMTSPHASKTLWTTKRASRVTLRVRCALCLRRNCGRR